MQNIPGRFLYRTYRSLTCLSHPLLLRLLAKRLEKGKEIPERVEEKKGITYALRPDGVLFWIHAASVGEIQSALVLIRILCARFPDVRVLVTTGTVTSARIIEDKLPQGALHQFYPLDHPQWVRLFLDRWKPDFVFWMESELWPNMLEGLRDRCIPAVLVNARISPRSFKAWGWAKPLTGRLLGTFSLILAQTDVDSTRLKGLGYSGRIVVTDNLKYSAADLPYVPDVLQALQEKTQERTLWVFSSTHKGEEEMAARVHKALKKRFPTLLTLIVPRHPERRGDIRESLEDCGLHVCFRGETHILPTDQDDLYIADTLGELGLFYRLCPVAVIGRSFSEDGGGGHNPLEAAQLGCAVLHGPNVQNLQQIYDEMDEAGAALRLPDEASLRETLARFFENTEKLKALQEAGQSFANNKAGVIDRVMEEIEPILIAALPDRLTLERVPE